MNKHTHRLYVTYAYMAAGRPMKTGGIILRSPLPATEADIDDLARRVVEAADLSPQDFLGLFGWSQMADPD